MHLMRTHLNRGAFPATAFGSVAFFWPTNMQKKARCCNETRLYLQQEIANKKADLQRMEKENQELRAEIEDLKKGLEAIQERARSELGMIKEGETYFQIVEPEQVNDD